MHGADGLKGYGVAFTSDGKSDCRHLNCYSVTLAAAHAGR